MTTLPKTFGEAYEAGLREGDRRTVERIAAKLGADKNACVPDDTCPYGQIGCAAHWLQYLTEGAK